MGCHRTFWRLKSAYVSLVSMSDATPLTINSPAAVTAAYNSQLEQQRQKRRDVLQSAVLLANNLGSGEPMLRTGFLKFLLDGPRDIDAECGYPVWLTPDHFKLMYDREGVAKRVVDCEPEESWAMDPDLYEDEDEDTDTEFEKAWKNLLEQEDIWYYLQRIDVLSGIGQYGIILIGIDDGKDLNAPVEGIGEDGEVTGQNDYSLLYLRPFSEEVVFVKTRETRVDNPRYGLPTAYTIQFRDFPNWGIQAGEMVSREVHWTRVVHVADNRKMSEVYGIPRMQPVYNRLYDLRKIYSSSGEAFWKGAFPGLAFEVNPEVNQIGVDFDKDSMRKEFDAYQNGLQRYLAVQGVTTKTLEPNIEDPSSTAKCHLQAIAIAKGIPYRVLFGSEEAKLAGEQDSLAWNKRLRRRQTKYLTPKLIRPFIDRLIAFGILPEPASYTIDWPDLNSSTDTEKANVTLVRTQACQAYVQGGVSQLIPPREFLTKELGYNTEEADAIMDGAEEFNKDGGFDDGEDDDAQPPADKAKGKGKGKTSGKGAPVGGKTRDDGNALSDDNLNGSTMAGKGKRVSAVLVHLPSMNTAGKPRRRRVR